MKYFKAGEKIFAGDFICVSEKDGLYYIHDMSQITKHIGMVALKDYEKGEEIKDDEEDDQ